MPPESRVSAALTPYQAIGGEVAVRELVRRFYAHMDTLPEAWGVRKMHAEELAGSEEKLFLFLSGWLGGPNLYVERFGPPFLRARHLPFAIGAAERDQWLLCMRRALDETVADASLRARLFEALAALADHMRNRAEPAA
jgi:hemoglobin